MIYPEFKKFVNLIGHDITISGYGTLPKSDNPCRVDTQERVIGKISGVPIVKTYFKGLDNLPDSEDGTYFIVNRITMDYIPIFREDVFCVDTGTSAVRDKNGQVIAVTQLSL
jgi:hypothetical protein